MTQIHDNTELATAKANKPVPNGGMMRGWQPPPPLPPLRVEAARKPRHPLPGKPKTAAQALSTGHRQRRPRRPSIGKMIAQAEKATGKPVTSVTLPDGTKLDFGQAKQEGNAVDEWIAKHARAPERH
jgi:hypothetical protein